MLIKKFRPKENPLYPQKRGYDEIPHRACVTYFNGGPCRMHGSWCDSQHAPVRCSICGAWFDKPYKLVPAKLLSYLGNWCVCSEVHGMKDSH